MADAPALTISQRPLWPVLLGAAVTFALLVALGIWQLQRLAWKEAMIAHIESRAHAPAASLPLPAAWPKLSPEDYDYRHVGLVGTFEHDKEALIFRGAPNAKGVEGPGYLVLTPLRLATGGYVIVNRGYVSLDRKDPATRASGQIGGEARLTGLMRPPEPRNPFTPDDNPEKGQYFTRDPALIAAHFGLADAAPFTIDADDRPVPGGWPRGGATVTQIPNNHLSYALTWFALAATLLGFVAVFLWRRFGACPYRSDGII
jgi:surfeit locus 1 family protein